jgi:hypothetical protein
MELAGARRVRRSGAIHPGRRRRDRQAAANSATYAASTISTYSRLKIGSNPVGDEPSASVFRDFNRRTLNTG